MPSLASAMPGFKLRLCSTLYYIFISMSVLLFQEKLFKRFPLSLFYLIKGHFIPILTKDNWIYIKHQTAVVSQSGANDTEGLRGPVLVKEPPDEVVIVSGAGAVRLPCGADGNPPPSVLWLDADAAGEELPLQPHHRYQTHFMNLLLSLVWLRVLGIR